MGFLTAFFTVLGQNIATVLTVGIVLGAAYLGLTPRGRLIIKSVGNFLTSNALNNPKIAAGVYDEKLKKLREMKKKAVALSSKVNGELAEKIQKEEEARRTYKKLSLDAKRLEVRGTEESHRQALLLARKAQESLIKADKLKASIPSIQEAVEAVADRLNEIDWKISNVEARKEMTLNDMERGKMEREVSEEMQDLDTTEIDASLKEIEKYADDTKYMGVGARMAYENSDAKLLKDAQNSADYDDAESFLKQLMESND